MAADATKLVIPGHGTVFQSAPNATLPLNPLDEFSLTGNAPAGWTSLGHTSKQNSISFTKEGGEPTTLDTFLADGVDVIYSATAWALSVAALQFDQNTLDLAFNGDWDPVTHGYIVPTSPVPVGAGLFVFCQGRISKLGFWIPNTTTTLGEAPTLDPENFTELPLSSTILSASNGVIPAVNGVPGIMEIFKTGLAPAAPAWKATEAYALNDRASLASGAILRASTAGTSGAAAPTAPATIGGTVTDGTVVWTRVA